MNTSAKQLQHFKEDPRERRWPGNTFAWTMSML